MGNEEKRLETAVLKEVREVVDGFYNVFLDKNRMKIAE